MGGHHFTLQQHRTQEQRQLKSGHSNIEMQ